MSDAKGRRDKPPTDDVVCINKTVGVYMTKTLRKDTDNPTFWHWCSKASFGERWRAKGTDDHELISADPLHLEPSLLCPDCGLHGFVRNGEWIAA
jgi:hypothetical protein